MKGVSRREMVSSLLIIFTIIFLLSTTCLSTVIYSSQQTRQKQSSNLWREELCSTILSLGTEIFLPFKFGCLADTPVDFSTQWDARLLKDMEKKRFWHRRSGIGEQRRRTRSVKRRWTEVKGIHPWFEWKVPDTPTTLLWVVDHMLI